MRQAAAALLALIGLLAAVMGGWLKGAPAEATLGRALLALAGFGALGYVLGVVGERLVREVLERRRDLPLPQAPVPGASPAPGVASGPAPAVAPAAVPGRPPATPA